jgi:hypothetical protein
MAHSPGRHGSCNAPHQFLQKAGQRGTQADTATQEEDRMSAIDLRAIVLPRQDVELERHFVAWEKSFHIRPCEASEVGVFPCGHASNYLADAKCNGCDEEITDVSFCDHHYRAYENGLVAMHLMPCGYLGFRVSFTNIRAV